MPTAYFFTKTNFFRSERDHQGKFGKFESTLDYFFDKAKRKIDHYRKVSQAMKGKFLPIEVKQKISESKKGSVPWNKGLHGENYLKHFGGKHPMLGRKHSKETRKKLSESHKGICYGPCSEERRQKISKANKGRKCPWVSERNKNPSFVRKVLRARQKRPTKPEQKLIEIIEKYSLPFRYTGDGRRIIGSRCPDFIHTRKTDRVVEVFGTYFHSPKINPNVLQNRTYDGTIEYYSQHGVDCLIFWDHELKNEQAVVDTLRRWC